MFIKLQVFWADEMTEEDQVLEKEQTYSLDYLVINSDYVIEYHPDDNGSTMISMLNGTTYRCPIDFDEFEQKYPALLAHLELVLSSEDSSN